MPNHSMGNGHFFRPTKVRTQTNPTTQMHITNDKSALRQPKTNRLNSERKCLPIDCRRHCCRWEQERQWFEPFFARFRWRRSPNIHIRGTAANLINFCSMIFNTLAARWYDDTLELLSSHNLFCKNFLFKAKTPLLPTHFFASHTFLSSLNGWVRKFRLSSL